MADKSDVIQDYLNSLNEAMAIHAKKAVEGLEFDRSELAEIVDITNRDKGEYQVFNGSTRYYAYSENTSYTLGTKVYVTIQNNDYTQQKLIKGRYKSTDGDTGIAWSSPLANFQPPKDMINLVESNTKNTTQNMFSHEYFLDENNNEVLIPINQNYTNSDGTGLLANYNKYRSASSEESDTNNIYASQYEVLFLSNDLSDNSDYNNNYSYMGLSAEFKTALSGFYPISGSYGLLILIDYTQRVEAPNEEPLHRLKVCKLDTSSMIGNVYNFNTFYKQEALYKLDNSKEKGLVINQVAVIFYQDGEFRQNDNKLVPTHYNNGDDLLPDNIFVKNIDIKFGDLDQGDVLDKAQIFSYNGLAYDSAQTNDNLNEKRIHLKWEHRNPEQEINDNGDRVWTYLTMDRSTIRNVPLDADIKIIANIHWYTNAEYSIDTYRATQAETANFNDEYYTLVEKWKNNFNSMTEEEMRRLKDIANLKQGRDFSWVWDSERIIGYEQDIDGNYVLDDMGEQIPIKGAYVLSITPSGERILEKATTRNAKEDKTTRVSDDLAGPNWIPIDGTFNSFDIDYQPNNKLQTSKVKCIIEYGPELKDENDNGTELVDTNSSYYTVIEPDILEFVNLSWVPDLMTRDSTAGLTFVLSDKTGGHYPIYNATDGRILSRSEVRKLRTIEAQMLSSYTGNSLLNGNEIILWQVPKTNSMININGTLTEDKTEVITEDNFDQIFGLNKEDFEAALNAELESLQESKEELCGTLNDYLSEAQSLSALDQENWTAIQELDRDVQEALNTVEEEYQASLKFYSDNKVHAHTRYLQYTIWADLLRRGASTTDPLWPGPKNTTREELLELAEQFKTIMETSEQEYLSIIEAKKAAAKETILQEQAELKNGLLEVCEELSNAQNELAQKIRDVTDDIAKIEQQYIDNVDILNRATFHDYDLTNYFDKNNFDFDNYYYLVRFGSDANGVNPFQGYYINEYYVKGATNNTIFCYLVKNNQIYKGEITFTFAQHGSSGTDYTFSLGLGELVKAPEDAEISGGVIVDHSQLPWEVIGPAATALTIGEEGFRRVRFELYDSSNELIELTNEEKHGIINEWISRSQKGYYSGYNKRISEDLTEYGGSNNLEFLVKKDGDYYVDFAMRAPKMPIENYRYIIMAASINMGATSTYNDKEYDVGPVSFVQMLPIHVKTDDKYDLDGADYITYDDKGTNPQSYSNEYDIFNIEDESFRIVVDNNDVSAEINGAPGYATTYKWYPHLDENNKLVPCTLYLSDLSRNIAVEALDDQDNVIYTMPLLMIQNRYQIPAVNSWNGELLIDEDGNRVMAATIAAGNKDINNRFSGVIMGDVERTNPSTNQAKLTTGLYGYNTGVEAFGFNSDGTAFIGKPGTGRIEFNGQNGWIQSANYAATTADNDLANEGTRIDLDDGSIDMWGRGYNWEYDDSKNKWVVKPGGTGLTTNIHLDTKGSSDKPYFKIAVPKYITTYEKDGDDDSTISSTQSNIMENLILIDKSNFYLKTADYDEILNTGLKIDLKNGTLDSRGKLIINGSLGSSITFGNSNNYLKLGTNGSGKSYLKSTGTITITGDSDSSINFGDKLNIRGNGTSTIGGWTINTNNLSANGITIGSGGSISSGSWGISGNGSAWFSHVTITGESSSIGIGTNSWNNNGFNYNGGTIAGGSVGLSGNNYGTTINAADKGVFDTLTVNYLAADTILTNKITAAEARITTLEADTVKTNELDTIFASGYRAYFQYVSADAVWVNGVDQQTQNSSFQSQIDTLRESLTNLWGRAVLKPWE